MRNFIQSCLLSAAEAIEREKKKGLKITSKGRNDWATSADFASERLIVGRIRRHYPDSLVLSEENYLNSDLLADSLFVVDPIDGTHNFAAGIPLYGVSIAHFCGGKPTAGGIYLIPQRQLFYAEKGAQSTLNGKKISVSSTARLEDFFLLCDSRLHVIAEQGLLPNVVALERMSRHTRFLGSAVHNMGYVACAVADAEIDFKLKPYDFAAAAFIVERAGGRVTDFEGRAWTLETRRFVSSNGRQHSRILEVLNGRA
ncbi:MAG: inositol monophosphatase family protein [Candidatus Micrarchaeota archaeon]|nr:inositol monophosphatase family protein [Candidatus Micrarchaeota archaeon]